MTGKSRATKSSGVKMSDFASASVELSGEDMAAVKQWITFLEAINLKFESMETAYVSLGFDSSLDAKTHYTFTPEEAVWPESVFISANGLLTFQCIAGKSSKTFNYRESELIEIKIDGEVYNLNDIIDNLFNEHCASIGFGNVTDLERHCLRNKEFANKLNTGRVALEQMLENEKAKVAYATVSNYGCF